MQETLKLEDSLTGKSAPKGKSRMWLEWSRVAIRREASNGLDVGMRRRRITDDTKIFDLGHWEDIIH